jgi:hypothetical protein
VKASQRQAIGECIEASRIHEKALARGTTDDLRDVLEGIAIGATKLQAVLDEDADDPRLDKKAVALLREAHAKSKKAVKEAREEVARFSAFPRGGLKWDWSGTLAMAVATQDAFEGALASARQALNDKSGVCAVLREWCASSEASMRVVRTGGRPIHSVFEELEENNGLKVAVLAVRQIIDFDVRTK